MSNPMNILGESFLQALAAQDFDRLEELFTPSVHFRAMVPSGERRAETAGDAIRWLRKWFGDAEVLQLVQSGANMMSDRLHIEYQFRLFDRQDGWQIIEQNVYCVPQDGKIADLWLACSGFRPDPQNPPEPGLAEIESSLARLNANAFYNAGNRGCAEGPLDEIVLQMSRLAPGQTLEVYATSPSVAGDLPAWCRMSGHELIQHDGYNYLIRHK